MPISAASPGRLSGEVDSPELSSATFATDGRTSIYVLRDGIFEWGGVMWGLQADLESGTMLISASGFLSYFDRRLINADVSYASVEQADILASLVAAAEAETGGSIGVASQTVATGTLRDRNYLASDLKTVGDAMRNLSRVGGGIDFYIDAAWDGSIIQKTLRSSFPQTGRVTGAVIDLDANVAGGNVSINGSKVITRSTATGDGSAANAVAANLALEAAVPRAEGVEAHPSVSEAATLAGHAARMLGRGVAELKILTLVMQDGVEPVVGSLLMGDVITVRGAVGFIDVEGLYRVTGISVAVDDSGSEVMTVTLASQEAWAV